MKAGTAPAKHSPFAHMHRHTCTSPNCIYKEKGYTCLKPHCTTFITRRCPSCETISKQRYERRQSKRK